MNEPQFSYTEILRALAKGDVDFVVIGGVAAALHGSATVTTDIDICYERSPDNIRKLVDVLRSLHAELRVGRGTNGAELPFILDEGTIASGGNFAFSTDLGDLDCFAWPAGIGGFDSLIARAETFEIADFKIAVATVDALLLMKRKAGRRRDLNHILELEEIKRIKEGGDG